MNPDLDLHLDRIIRAPRSAVWEAWTDPASLADVVAARTDAVPCRTARHGPGWRVRDLDER